jgi:integrase
MPKKPKEPIHCQYFTWCLFRRGGVYYADGRGGHKRLGKHSLGTRNRQQALENLRRLDRQKAVEKNLAPKEPTSAEAQLSIEQGWALFLEDRGRPLVLGGVGTGSLKRYKAVRDKHILYCIEVQLDTWSKVDRAAVLAYGTWLHKRRYAAPTVVLELNTVASVVNLLVGKNRLPPNSRFSMGLPKIEESDRYCYRREEVTAMLEHCRKDPSLGWLGDVIVSLAVTGLRIGELAKMRWRDVDLAANTLCLTDERASKHRQHLAGARLLKGKRSRSLPLNADFRRVLERMPHEADGLVFHGPRGGRLKPDTVRIILSREAIDPLKQRFPTPAGEVGFEHGCLHSFRHYFVSEAFRRGATEPWIMQWVGHRESRIVARYRHLRDDDGQREMARLDLLGAEGNPDGPGSV